MERTRIYLLVFLLVGVLGAILAFKAMSVGGAGGSSGGGEDVGTIQIRMVSPSPGDAGDGDGDPAAATGGGEAASGVAITLVGSDGDGSLPGAAGGDGDSGTAGASELPPLAALGAAEGIHTVMDSSWFPEREASEWFEPLERDFQAARPLTPERYKEVLGEHHERIGSVLKRSAEIGDTSDPEEGIAFLEAWNELVDQYKAEAYGS